MKLLRGREGGGLGWRNVCGGCGTLGRWCWTCAVVGPGIEFMGEVSIVAGGVVHRRRNLIQRCIQARGGACATLRYNTCSNLISEGCVWRDVRLFSGAAGKGMCVRIHDLPNGGGIVEAREMRDRWMIDDSTESKRGDRGCPFRIEFSYEITKTPIEDPSKCLSYRCDSALYFELRLLLF